MAGNAGPTVQDIINEALGILGVYQGDPLAPSDLQSAFFTFCALIDGWGLEPLTFRQTSVLQCMTTAGKSSYLVGPTALNTAPAPDWATPFVPLEFGLGSVQMVTGTLEIEVAIDSLSQWESIAIKSMQSSILSDCWPDMGTTSATLNFFPVPSTSIPINLYLPYQLAKPTATTATMSLAPGYQEALTFELAIKCSSKFGATVPAWLPEAWLEAKAKIKAANWEPLDARCDAALLSRRGGHAGGGSIAFYTGQ